MLEVAARRTGPGRHTGTAARPGAGDASSTSTASAAHEALPLLGLGDARAHPLARERVPDEDDPALVPGDAVPAVGDGPDVDVDLVADGELAGLCSAGVSHSPRRTAPTDGAVEALLLTPSDDASCQGTLATMTPGVKSSRALSRSALWLCRTCSHQCPRTYSGM